VQAQVPPPHEHRDGDGGGDTEGPLGRIYLMLSVTSLGKIVTNYYRHVDETEWMWSISGIVIFTANAIIVYRVGKNATLSNATFALMTLSLLWCFNLAKLIYELVVQNSWWSLVSVIGLFIQMTTWYILLKLRDKIVDKSTLLDGDTTGEEVRQPMLADAI
jgi:hypothetical protein